MEKLVITAAITGNKATKEMNPNLPITAADQGRETKNCFDSGASVVHLHVRDREGRPSANLEDFRASIEEIKRYCRDEIILQFSVQGVECRSFEEKIAPIVHFRPDMAALSVSSMNLGQEVLVNEPAEVERLARHMLELNVRPIIECYDTGDIEAAQNLAKRGFLKEPLCYQFILGSPGALSGEVYNLNHLVSMLRPGDVWSVGGVGKYQLPLAVMAIVMGGHVRVGFEDNVFYHKGQLSTGNAQLVARIKRLAQELGREIASAAQARRIFSICQA